MNLATLWTAKNTHNFSFMRFYFKNGTVKFFPFVEFDKQDKVQLLPKFKKILYMGLRATLNVPKFKVALNPMWRIFLKLCQKLHLYLLIKILQKEKNSPCRFWNLST